MRECFFLLFSLLFFGCSDEAQNDPINSDRPNILLIIADDLGKDATAGFAEGVLKPTTPNIDQIRDAGLSFTNFWSYPTCTPTRASIITGKYGYRTGMKQVGDVLNASETTIQKAINDETNNAYATAIIGKWHLSGNTTAEADPESFGIDHYAGLISGGVQNYYKWMLTEDGTSTMNEEYITKVFTDLAIEWVAAQDKPWFLWLAYNAPHTPFHLPPDSMHNQGNLAEYEEGEPTLPYYLAAIEALDFQIGRLMESMTEEDRAKTIILFIGDNGTPGQVAQYPYSMGKAKGSLYQGGINVPMYVSGANVTRTGVDNNLVTSTDIFATLLEIAGGNNSEIHDSKSLLPIFSVESDHRSVQYSESKSDTNESWTIGNGRYKLIIGNDGTQEMYNLQADPYEEIDLLEGTLTSEEADAKASLETELSQIRN